MASAQVTNFDVARYGFGFPNAFDRPFVLNTRVGKISFGANAGLCGGMTFASLDYFSAGHPAPAEALPVRKQRVRNLAEFQTSSVILTQNTEFGSSYLLETARGCARCCRFCLASYGFMPQRERKLEDLVEQARYGLQFRDKIGLMGPSVSDYHAIDELVTAIRAMGGKMSLASMRADSISPAILKALIL